MPRIHKTKFELHEWKAKEDDNTPIPAGSKYLYTYHPVTEGHGNICAFAGDIYNRSPESNPISYKAKEFLEDYEHVRAFTLQDK